MAADGTAISSLFPCGYPQLASEARFAAGQIGHAADGYCWASATPFIGHLDLDELLPGAQP